MSQMAAAAAEPEHVGMSNPPLIAEFPEFGTDTDATLARIRRLLDNLPQAAELEYQQRQEAQRCMSEIEEEMRSANAKKSVWRCLAKPRMAVRVGPSQSSSVVRTIAPDEEIEAIAGPDPNGWIQLKVGEYALTFHAQLGKLLECVIPANNGRSGNEPLAAERAKGRIRRFAAQLSQHHELLVASGLSSPKRRLAECESQASGLILDESRRLALEVCAQMESGSGELEEKVADVLAVKKAVAEDGTPFFTCDLFGTGRGACVVCRHCSWYRWTPPPKWAAGEPLDLKDPDLVKCRECGCKNSAHINVGACLGEPGTAFSDGW